MTAYPETTATSQTGRTFVYRAVPLPETIGGWRVQIRFGNGKRWATYHHKPFPTEEAAQAFIATRVEFVKSHR
jgi:hypothetical protein